MSDFVHTKNVTPNCAWPFSTIWLPATLVWRSTKVLIAIHCLLQFCIFPAIAVVRRYDLCSIRQILLYKKT